jgi:predicted transcriptional regulator
MVLTQEDLELLKQLKAAGERGRTIHMPSTRTRLARLVRGGYVVDRGLVVYRITQRGQDAVAEHAG